MKTLPYASVVLVPNFSYIGEGINTATKLKQGKTKCACVQSIQFFKFVLIFIFFVLEKRKNMRLGGHGSGKDPG